MKLCYGLLDRWQCGTVPLSPQQRADVDSLTLDKRRRERTAVYHMLNRLLGYQPVLLHDSNGRPYIDDVSGLYLSVTHSATMAGVMIDTAPCGIDIQEVDARLLRLRDKYLSVGEQMLFGDDMAALTEAWCLKEAAYKAAGTPGLPLADGIAISRGAGGSYRIEAAGRIWHGTTRTVGPDCILATVTAYVP